MEKLRIRYKNNKIWIYPLRYISIALLLSVLTIMIDTGHLNLGRAIPKVFFTKLDLAKTILATLAGSLLSITTFTFSTTLVVLTMYSSSFSPRVVENFLEEKITMKVLGVFMWGFFYCITSLLFMRESLSSPYVISATIGVIYAVLCLFYFSIFVNKGSRAIQATNLISKLRSEARKTILEIKSFVLKYDIAENYDLGEFVFRKDIRSNQSGYLELIDYDVLYEKTRRKECMLLIYSELGSFIQENRVIASIYSKKDTSWESREFENCFLFQENRTAVHCINILGLLIGEIADIEERFSTIKSYGDKGVLVFPIFNFEKELHSTLYPILSYGKEDLSIVLSLYGCLENIHSRAGVFNKSTSKNFQITCFPRQGKTSAIPWN